MLKRIVISLGIVGLFVLGPILPMAVLADVQTTNSSRTSGSAGASVSANNAWTGTNSFIDSNFSVLDNGDNTKVLKLEASSCGTGTTCTITWPAAASGTIVDLATNQSITGTKTFSITALVGTGGYYLGASGVAQNLVKYATENTPDTGALSTGTTSNAWNIVETQDSTSDFNNGSCGSASCTHPQVNVFPNALSTTQYNSIAYFGNAGGFRKTLTESAATSAIRIPVAAGAGAGGVFNYCVFASDATDQQQRCGKIKFSVTNKAAAETCGLNTDTAVANDASITETEDGNATSISAGTLTYAITCDTTPANAVDIQINAVSSLTQTTLEARGFILSLGPGQPAPQ